jgi:hypothetical protein
LDRDGSGRLVEDGDKRVVVEVAGPGILVLFPAGPRGILVSICTRIDSFGIVAESGSGTVSGSGKASVMVIPGVLSAVLAILLVLLIAALRETTLFGAALPGELTRTNELVESDRTPAVLSVERVSRARLFRRNQSMTFFAALLDAPLLGGAAC